MESVQGYLVLNSPFWFVESCSSLEGHPLVIQAFLLVYFLHSLLSCAHAAVLHMEFCVFPDAFELGPNQGVAFSKITDQESIRASNWLVRYALECTLHQLPGGLNLQVVERNPKNLCCAQLNRSYLQKV